jgi:four helix bundle protein
MAEGAETDVQAKSYAFALRTIALYRHLTLKKKEFVLSKQMLRSGTAIGANVEAALGATSGKDFSAQMKVACQAARETHYWLRLLRDTGFLEPGEAASLLSDCEALLKRAGSKLNR